MVATPNRERIIHRPTVLVHGTRTSSAIWDEQTASLLEHGHPSVAIDLPGHGTRTEERFTLAGALDAIDDAVRSCSEPPLLVGMSLGGYTCLAYASRHPDRIAGVVLASCSTELRGKPLSAYRAVSVAINRLIGLVRLGSDSWHVVGDMLAAMSGYSPLADLARLRAPLWLVNGRRDPLRLDEWRYRRAVPRARLTVVARAGHDVNLHAPAAFNRVLLEALHELRAPLLT
ncbi:MAG: alpha/beta fold hydrolase [Cellulomonas sp.]|nr:alpha/beta fold hydrolase [Cellulomonas sp.]